MVRRAHNVFPEAGYTGKCSGERARTGRFFGGCSGRPLRRSECARPTTLAEGTRISSRIARPFLVSHNDRSPILASRAPCVRKGEVR